MVAALALVLAPVAARAAASEPAPGAQPRDVFEPIDIPPPPALPKPEPPPEPEPVVEPEPEPVEPPVEGPKVLDPAHLAKIAAQRKAGIGVMAAGGAVALAGFGMTLTFTILGDKAQDMDEPVMADIEKNDSMARVGGILLASGVALVAVGGILFANANKKAEQMARIRVLPAFGGVVLSGRF
jgi:outer membrane biosynthesis protein TonB